MSPAGALVEVRLAERGYAIEIGAGNLPALGKFVTQRGAVSHAVVITDSHVEQPYAGRAAESLAEAGATVDLLVIEPGEESKSTQSADWLWQELLELKVDRKTLIVAVGGGVIGDLAGFVAATFTRGLAFVQVPTTLLAQVDSSVGGKVGVNLPGAKNMVGAFWQPQGVLIDVDSLATLPEREYRSGLAEVVKYGVIMDADFFAFLEANAQAIIERRQETLIAVIARCCRLKADVVENDEREETGLRAVLNYGHTFGHALEATTGYARWLHGEAVSVGMMCAARLAQRLGRVDARFVARQRALLETFGLPIDADRVDPAALWKAMQLDKKVHHGHLRFVLPTRLGHVELVGGIAQDDVTPSWLQ